MKEPEPEGMRKIDLDFNAETLEVKIVATIERKRKLDVMKRQDLEQRIKTLGLNPTDFKVGIFTVSGLYFIDNCGDIYHANTMDRVLVKVKGVPKAFFYDLVPKEWRNVL